MIDRTTAFFLQRRRTFVEYLWKAVFSRHQARQIAQMAAFVSPGDVVIDVGANVGFFARGFARAVGEEGAVLAFEPQTVPRSILAAASFFKRNQNIVLLPFALGEARGHQTLAIPFKPKGNVGINLAHTGDTSDFEGRYRTKLELVPAARLDEVMTHFDFGRVSLIKIDVEGAELSVLKGAEGLIRRDRPIIICEIDQHGARFGAEPTDLASFLEQLGYRPYGLESQVLLEAGQFERNTVFKPDRALEAAL